MQSLIDFYTSTLGVIVPPELFIFVISMIPVLEMRAGLVIAALLGIPIWKAAIICYLGNALIVPFALLFLRKIIKLLSFIKPLGKLFGWIEAKTLKHQDKLEKGEFFGLLIIVGIPIPGTGAWTGALLASLLGVKFKRAMAAIMLGIAMAEIIMLIVSYGVLGNIVS